MSYADIQLGIWSDGFSEKQKAALNDLQARVAAACPDITMDAMVTAVIDRGERAGLCTPEQAATLREHFVAQNGLPLVLDIG